MDKNPPKVDKNIYKLTDPKKFIKFQTQKHEKKNCTKEYYKIYSSYERKILKIAREKRLIKYKGTKMRMMADYTEETMQVGSRSTTSFQG